MSAQKCAQRGGRGAQKSALVSDQLKEGLKRVGHSIEYSKYSREYSRKYSIQYPNEKSIFPVGDLGLVANSATMLKTATGKFGLKFKPATGSRKKSKLV